VAGVVDVEEGLWPGWGQRRRSLEWLGLLGLNLKGREGWGVSCEGDSDVGGAIGHGLVGLGSQVFAISDRG